MRRTALKRKTPLKAAVRPQARRKALKTGKGTKPKQKPLGARIKAQKGKTWAAVSLFIRTRDPWCVTCKVKPATQAGHYKHNSDKQNQQLGGNALWYDPRNIAGQCAACNLFRSGNPRAYALFLEETYGPGILQELERLFQTPRKWTLEELAAKELEFKQKLEALP